MQETIALLMIGFILGMGFVLFIIRFSLKKNFNSFVKNFADKF